MDTATALNIARDLLFQRAAETDTASPEGTRLRNALTVVEAILAQRGCEHHDPAVQDGRLTTLVDVIVWG